MQAVEGEDRASALERATMRRVAWRLIPFLCLLYVIAYVDRINVGFAALTMSADIGLTPAMFGFGAGLFFVAYFLFEVPSNLILDRVGARLWIARVMVSWGLVSMAFAFVGGPNQFYALRFLLGAAEAGFFPGVILYLTYWFPKRWRGRVTAGFAIAVPLASAIAAPISGYLLTLDGLMALRGWQWMFLLEAIPAILLGVVCLFYLTDRPEQATWLTDEQRGWLVAAMRAEQGDARPHGMREVLGTLVSPPVLGLALVYFGLASGLYGTQLWLPQIVQGFGLSPLAIGFVSALPHLLALATMGWWARRSDRTGERFNHVALASLVACAGLVLAGLAEGPIPTLLCLAVAIAGVMAMLPPFWQLPTEFLSGTQAAAGIAAINALGNLGGFASPALIGWVRESTGSFSLGLMVPAGALALSATVTLVLKRAAKGLPDTMSKR